MSWRIFVYKNTPSFWPAESTVYVAKPGETVKEYIVNDANVPSQVGGAGGSFNVEWGDLAGDITNQVDLQTILDSLISDIASLNSNTAALAAAVSTNTTNISSINSAIITLNNSINSINSAITTINTSISTINSTLTTKLDASTEYIELLAGDALDNNTFGYLGSDGLVYTAFKDANEAIGFIPVGATAGNIVRLYLSKRIYPIATTSIPSGTPLYLSSNGTFESFNPHSKFPQRIGIVIDTTHFLLDIHPWRPSDKPYNTFALQRRQLNY